MSEFDAGRFTVPMPAARAPLSPFKPGPKKFFGNVTFQDSPTTDSRYWPRPAIIQVAFLNGNNVQQQKVKDVAETWLRYAPRIKFKWIDGIEGHVRVAFVDKLDKKGRENLSWSYVGTDALGSNPTPETVRLAGISPNSKDMSRAEIRLILHGFGHVLGLNYPRKLETAFPLPINPIDGVSPGPWLDALVKISPRELYWREYQDVRDFIPSDCVPVHARLARDPHCSIMEYDFQYLLPPQVLQYYSPKQDQTPALKQGYGYDTPKQGYGYDTPKQDQKPALNQGYEIELCCVDKCAIGDIYGIEAKALSFSTHKELDMRSPVNENDLDVYALDWNNVIYRNTRKHVRTGEVVLWTGWERIVENVPEKTTIFTVCDLSDRLEIYAVADERLYYRYRLKTDDKSLDSRLLLKPENKWLRRWQVWYDKDADLKNGPDQSVEEDPEDPDPDYPDPVDPVFPAAQIPDRYRVKVIASLEVDGGFEVFTISGDRNELGHIPRRPTHYDLPLSGPYAIKDGKSSKSLDFTLVDKKTCVFAAGNAASATSSYAAALDRAKDGHWDIGKLALELDNEAPTKPYYDCFATGMATTTQHLFIVDKDKKLHHNSNPDTDSNWANWDWQFDTLQFDPSSCIKDKTFECVITGACASNPAYNDCVHVFVVDCDGNLYYNMVDRDNNWGGPGLDSGNYKLWCTGDYKLWSENYPADPSNPNKGEWDIENVKDRSPTVKNVYAQTTQCGDLEVFAIGREDKDKRTKNNRIYRLRLGPKGWDAQWARDSWVVCSD